VYHHFIDNPFDFLLGDFLLSALLYGAVGLLKCMILG